MQDRIIGADLSLNHGAMVLLEDNKLLRFWYYTTTVGSAKQYKLGYHMKFSKKNKDKQTLHIMRLAWIRDFVGTILKWEVPNYIALEDYALDIKHGSHYQGELGGIVRMVCWKNKIPMRLHDPVSLKMFTTHDGKADKVQMEEAVKKRWNVKFDKANCPVAKPTIKNPNPKQNRETSQDLCDAYALARLLLLELKLRTGVVGMSDLHEKEIRVFNRITRAFPVNLLDRDFIVDPEFSKKPSFSV